MSWGRANWFRAALKEDAKARSMMNVGNTMGHRTRQQLDRRRDRVHRVLWAAAGFAVCLGSESARAADAQWLNAISGNWTDAAKWSTAPAYPNGPFDNATVAATGAAYTLLVDANAMAGQTLTLNRLDVNSANATVQLTNGTLSATLINVNAGGLLLDGGTVRGTVAGLGGSVNVASGTLDGLTVQRGITIITGYKVPAYTPPEVRNGLTFNNGSLEVMSPARFIGAQTLAGTGTVNLWANSICSVDSGPLTISPGVLVHGRGEINHYAAKIINNGTLRADLAGAALVLNSTASSSLRFENYGVMEATNGGILRISDRFNNANGIIRANGGTVEINGAGQYSTPDLGTLQAISGDVLIGGDLSNTNATLTATPQTGKIWLGAHVYNGAIASSGGAEFPTRNTILEKVTLTGRIAIRPPSTTSGALVCIRGMTMAGGSIVFYPNPDPDGGPNGEIWAEGVQTLQGTGEIVFAGNGKGHLRVVRDVIPTGGLTIGPGITIRTDTGSGIIGNEYGDITNQGSVLAQTPGQSITLYAVINQGTMRAENGGYLDNYLTSNSGTIVITGASSIARFYGTWNNSGGTVRVTAGGTLNLESIPAPLGSIEISNSTLALNCSTTSSVINQMALSDYTLIVSNGITIDNTGQTLSFPGNSRLQLSGRINGGTISGTLAQVAGSGELQGVTLALPLEIPSGNQLLLYNGLGFRGGRATLDQAKLLLMNATTFSGDGEIVLGGTGLSTVQGSMSLGPNVVLRSGGGGGTVGASTSVTLVNDGLISAQTAGKSISLVASSVTNRGILEARDGGTLDISAGVVSSGTIRAQTGGSLSLLGSWTNTGRLQLDDNSSLTLGGSFNVASLTTGFTRGNNTTLTLCGTLTNNGPDVLSLNTLGPIRLAGSVTVNGGTVVGSLGNGFSGSGTSLAAVFQSVELNVPITISGGATLTLSGNWTNSGPITLTDSTLNLNGTFDLASVGTISRSGGVVNLRGTLLNTGQTLLLNSQTGTWTSVNGSISGGTVRVQSPARLYIPSGNRLTLSSVTLDANLSLQGSTLVSNARLTLPNRQITGNGTVQFTGRIDGPGTLGYWDSTSNLLQNTSAASGTLGPDLLVRAEYLTIRGGSGGIVNQGTIRALGPAGVILLSNVTNQGTIELETGTTLKTADTPVTTARVVFNSGRMYFKGPGIQVVGVVDNSATGEMTLNTGAEVAFNSAVSGTIGSTIRIQAGATANFNGGISGPITIQNDGTANLGTGSITFGLIDGDGGLTVPEAALVSADRVRAGSLQVSGQLKMRAGASSSAASKTGGFIINKGAKVDLGDNPLAIDYSSTLPGFTAADARAKIIEGRAGGTWGGTGLVSSLAAADPSNWALGYGEASDLLGSNGGAWMGLTVDGSTLLVRNTIMGDSNLDGIVNFTDLVAVAQNYNRTGTGVWTCGDFNYDGNVDFADLVAVAQHYNASIAQGGPVSFEQALAEAFGQAVPEPGSWLGLGLFTLALTGRRRRRVPNQSQPPAVLSPTEARS